MCFSLTWLLYFLIWLVVVGAVVAILRLLLPYALAQLGVAADLIMRVINIIIVAIVVIAVIYLVIELLACVGFGVPRVH